MSCDVTLVVHAGRDAAIALAEQTAVRLAERGLSVELIPLGATDEVGGQDLLDMAEPAMFVSLGGDGTFLRAARRAHELDVPILGVNFGRVGYLLDVPPAELDSVIADSLENRLQEERRAGLRVTLRRDGVTEGPFFAINELSVEKTVPGHVVRLGVEIDGEPLLTYAADGVVIATPTGSTAYNLSAGGPVLSGSLDGLVITPVAPHFVIDRSVVLDGQQTVTLQVVGERSVVCVIDGVETAVLQPGDRAECRRDARWLRVVALSERSIGRRLRESLRQGHE